VFVSLKKIVLAAGLCFGSLSAMAMPAGAYVGFGTGININTDNWGTSYRGMPLTLFAGYGGMMDGGFYLAGELIGNAGTGTLNNNGLKSTWSMGAALLPGILLSEHTLGFMRLGWVRNHFTSGSTNKSGGEVGVGLQTSVARDWDIRGEYDYIQYSGSLKTDQVAIGLVYRIM